MRKMLIVNACLCSADKSLPFGRGSRVEGKWSRVEGKWSRVEGKWSRVEGS